MKFLTYFLD